MHRRRAGSVPLFSVTRTRQTRNAPALETSVVDQRAPEPADEFIVNANRRPDRDQFALVDDDAARECIWRRGFLYVGPFPTIRGRSHIVTEEVEEPRVPG